MDLATVWFVIVAVFWTGFFVLEGFDFGVGALHALIGRSETERRHAIGTIAPFWDGNEVWLVVGTAAIFAAFPAWFATWFSALYLGIVLLLLALMLRGVALEWRGKGEGHSWRGAWTAALATGSILAPLVLGVALGDLLAGLPIDEHGAFTGRVWSLFTGFGVWTGLTLVALCLMHGATFLAVRTTGDLRARSQQWGRTLGIVALVMVAVFAVWTVLIAQPGWLSYLLLAVALLAVAASLYAARRGSEKGAFVATAVAIAATVGSLFASLFPDVLVSSTSSANSLTVAGSASSVYALTVMSVVAAVFFPVVLLYQGYTYVVLRRRVGGASASAPSDHGPKSMDEPNLDRTWRPQ
ncbi:cytochrome C oxidase assembly protein [Microbacterium sp. Root61]|uniref:cytochrome d ubiquinol oxidase subunit II n=1 Tax=Microbacterium sp. Root61 TaxID=1736570 RepID=UPI0006FE8943|nr:cytochrome d ubiquinol oxidase subunit II [Microbacterium sp. Root61]KRA25768.1 cytochrome C oxidase assembly protein [Microbacterium sp. Root61]